MTDLNQARFNDHLGYCVKEFESDVRNGQKAEQTMADYITKHGVGYALEWAASHVIDSMHGRVASATVLPALAEVRSVEDLRQVYERLVKMAMAETSYMSLGNSQLHLTGKMAMCQSLVRASQKVGALVNFLRERKED